MSTIESGLAAGGGPLDGDRWMRVAFLDESGIGSLTQDPVLVAAGVIVDADRSVIPLQTHLHDLMTEFLPKGAKRPSHFHAKDIWNGHKEFDGDVWEDTRRFRLLESLATIPRDFGLHVVCGTKDRIEFEQKFPSMTARERLHGCYQIAATVALLQIEMFMRDGVGVQLNEVANVYFEQNNEVVNRARAAFRFLRSEGAADPRGGFAQFLPLRKIFATPSYQEKDDASLLHSRISARGRTNAR